MGERWGLRGRRKRTRAAWFAVRVGVDGVDRDQSSGEASFLVCEKGLQEGHGIHEVAFLGDHREVDGVEVPLAVEATPQIGAGIDGREVLTAGGAQEGQLALPLLVRPSKLLKQQLPRDVVAQSTQEAVVEVSWHIGAPGVTAVGIRQPPAETGCRRSAG